MNYDVLQKLYSKNGYNFFDSGVYNVNIFGIRSEDRFADVFNDKIGVAFRDFTHSKRVLLFKATTDPGVYFLGGTMGNCNGTAILMPGQYRSCWKLGYHKGKYEALVQSEKSNFKVWRDNDMDGELDFSGDIYNDVTGLNCHTTSFVNEIDKVGAYSAGCQVIQDDIDFNIFLSIIKKSTQLYGEYLSYTLFDEK